jgi:hypothetical protein
MKMHKLVYMYVYTHMYLYTCIDIYIYICVHLNIFMYLHMFICIYISIYIGKTLLESQMTMLHDAQLKRLQEIKSGKLSRKVNRYICI